VPADPSARTPIPNRTTNNYPHHDDKPGRPLRAYPPASTSAKEPRYNLNEQRGCAARVNLSCQANAGEDGPVRMHNKRVPSTSTTSHAAGATFTGWNQT
jgi:hypothetical protein